MAWCPKCKAEYREEFNICSGCNVALVSELQVDREVDYDKEAFLIAVNSDLEAQILESLLLSNGIPVLKKYNQAGGYLKIYMGATNFGVNLYVPSRLLKKAQEIVDTQNEVDMEGTSISDEENMTDLEKAYQTQRRIKTWIIVPGLLWICITVVWTLMKHIFG